MAKGYGSNPGLATTARIDGAKKGDSQAVLKLLEESTGSYLKKNGTNAPSKSAQLAIE